MTGDFIHPNYHVLLLHVPIGLLIVGFLGELIALVRPHHGLRAAARWMVVVGALMALPTALAGVYALRDVLVPGDRIALNMTWPQVAGAGGWPREQWHFMTHHAQYNVAAAVAVVLAAAGWLASGRPWRDRLPLPLLLVLAAGVVLLTIGAWYGGEAVYRFGTGVEPSPPAGGVPGGLAHYLPPLQWHIVLAGYTAALAVLAAALTFGRSRTAAADAAEAEPVATGPSPYARAAWWLAVLVTLPVPVLAAWWMWPAFSIGALTGNLRMIVGHARLLLHVIVGVSILVLLLVLALRVRPGRGRRRATGVLAAVLAVLLGVQVWLGVLMLFDSPAGSLLGFSRAADMIGSL
ncbi:MAG: hypothetical protein GX591_10865 [Planctomycetes bacterium]|nr:hypothetical protein [Planctomycetota bacterium]